MHARLGGLVQRFVALGVGLSPCLALAGPITLTHQVRLLDSVGEPVVGTHIAEVSLWSDATSTDGQDRLWTATYNPMDFDLGYASFVLSVDDDTTTTVDSTWFGDPTWVQISIDGTPLLPRNEIYDVPGATGGGSSTVVALVDAATIAVDGAAGDVFDVTVAGNRTLGDPTGLVNGQAYTFRVTQDATGGRTLDFGSAYKFPVATPTISPDADATTVLGFTSDGTSLYSSWSHIPETCVPGSQSFLMTGSTQAFTVPAGCTSVTIKAWGAGGAGGDPQQSGSINSYGGGAGLVTGDLAVRPGQMLGVVVGEGGKITSAAAACTSLAYGGGARGCVNSHSGAGGGGGGRSAISVSGTEVLVAAGGGGGGGYYTSCGSGGAGGGLTGQGGTGTGGGYPGTQVGAGAGGTDNNYNPMPGTIGAGGDAAHISGGGGGGYYGGGGGSHGNTVPYGGGGAGGSSYFGGAGVSGGATTPGSDTTPGASGDSDYVTGTGTGGSPQTLGGNGRVLISW